MSLVSQCKSNSDSKCLCPSSDYISKVQQCVTSWGKDDKEVQDALSYLVGICADFIPQNPGICTNVPTTITLTQNPPADKATVVPVTTITYTVTYTTSDKVESKENVVTVPQVGFYTDSTAPAAPGATVTANVGLVPAPASSTQAGPANTGSATTSGPIATFTGAAVSRSVSNLSLVGAFGLLVLLI